MGMDTAEVQRGGGQHPTGEDALPAAIVAYVDRIVAEAPALTADQASRLQSLLGGTPTAPRRASVAA